MPAFQAGHAGSTPATRSCPRGEMDITLDFGSGIRGSNPLEGATLRVTHEMLSVLPKLQRKVDFFGKIALDIRN